MPDVWGSASNADDNVPCHRWGWEDMAMTRPSSWRGGSRCVYAWVGVSRTNGPTWGVYASLGQMRADVPTQLQISRSHSYKTNRSTPSFVLAYTSCLVHISCGRQVEEGVKLETLPLPLFTVGDQEMLEAAFRVSEPIYVFLYVCVCLYVCEHVRACLPACVCRFLPFTPSHRKGSCPHLPTLTPPHSTWMNNVCMCMCVYVCVYARPASAS
jgi:hypothetical protein